MRHGQGLNTEIEVEKAGGGGGGGRLITGKIRYAHVWCVFCVPPLLIYCAG